MLGVARGDGPLREPATWWLLNRMSNTWADHDLGPALKAAGIYDPDAITLQAVAKPEPPADLRAIAVDEVAGLTGNAARGRQVAAQCTMCHTVEGTGASVGPALDGWGRGKTADVIAAAIINPDGDIAQGFGGTELTTTDGLVIQGLLIKQGDPLMMRSMGGITQIIPADRVERRRNMGSTSLMIGAAALGLTAQDVADLVAFLQGS